jgi:N-acetylglucosaminyl-diphospho-decaprenol L-rhamnosyltransferase
LRIAVNGLAARFGGTAYMVSQIASALSDREDVEHVWVLVSAGSVAERALRPASKTTPIGVGTCGRLNLARRAVWETTQLPRLVRDQSIDRVLTVSGMLLREPGSSVIVHLTNPMAYERDGLPNRLRRSLIRRTVRRCDAVIVPTRAMGDLVETDTGARPLVLPLGVDSRIFSPAENPGQDILYVSDFYAHKRHDLAIEAWLKLSGPRPRLRFIGNPSVDRDNFKAVRARALDVDPRGDRLLIESHLSLGELVDAYRSAGVFLLPSEHESFSMPLAEALACGVPAVVRDLPSLRETGADGAVFIGSDDPGAWAQALERLTADPVVHRSLRERAMEHAKRFSGDAVAAAIVAPQPTSTRSAGPPMSGKALAPHSADGDKRPIVTVIVVTFNNATLIERCLAAIRSAVSRWPYEIVVVDNHSSDQTLERARAGGERVHCVALNENRGFAAANNLAIAAARGRYVALVNSDAFPDPGSIDRLVDLLQAREQVGIVGARLRYPSGTLQPSAARFPSLLGNLWVACFLHRAPGLSRLGFGVYSSPALYRRARRVDWVTAAFCAARREVGPLPEDAFMYGEDVEWACRALARGYTTWVQPAATAVHISASTVQDMQRPGFKQAQRVAFELRWFRARGRLRGPAARAIMAVHACVRLGLYGLLYFVRPTIARRGIAEFGVLLRRSLTPGG